MSGKFERGYYWSPYSLHSFTSGLIFSLCGTKNDGWLHLPQCCTASQHRGELKKDPWSFRQNAPVKWLPESKRSLSRLTVISACSRRRQEADRRLQLSFDTRIQRGSISLKLQTDGGVSFLSVTRARRDVFLLNCAQSKIILSGGDAKLTAYPSSAPWAAKSPSRRFFFTV